ncbi:uncharacterized protein [Pyxicephalus adspersus]|uniref:uncharacterized protein n=1 Tax=Pyxicephalus adspersus TaxID=30357 RepID=UPI003B5CE9D1
MVPIKPVVGIVSREHPESHHWLTSFLSSLPGVNDVPCIHLSRDISPDFREEMSQCDFVVFYNPNRTEGKNEEEEHRRGENFMVITETEPPIDKDLVLVSQMMEKKNILIVTDEPERGTSEEKIQNLQNQDSYRLWMQEVIQFPGPEKTFPSDSTHFNMIPNDPQNRNPSGIPSPNGSVKRADMNSVSRADSEETSSSLDDGLTIWSSRGQPDSTSSNEDIESFPEDTHKKSTVQKYFYWIAILIILNIMMLITGLGINELNKENRKNISDMPENSTHYPGSTIIATSRDSMGQTTTSLPLYSTQTTPTTMTYTTMHTTYNSTITNVTNMITTLTSNTNTTHPNTTPPSPGTSTDLSETTINVTSGHIVDDRTSAPPVFTTQNTTPRNYTGEYTTYNDTKPTDYTNDYVTVTTQPTHTSSHLNVTTTSIEMSTDSPEITINVTLEHTVDDRTSALPMITTQNTTPRNYTTENTLTSTSSTLTTTSVDISTDVSETTINVTSEQIVNETTRAPPLFTIYNTTPRNYTTEYTTYNDTKPKDYTNDYVTSSLLNITTTNVDISTDSPKITINATSGQIVDESTTAPPVFTTHKVTPTNYTTEYITYNNTKPTDYITTAGTSSPLNMTTTSLEMSTDTTNNGTKPKDYTNDTATTQSVETSSLLNSTTTNVDISTHDSETTNNVTSGHIDESTASPPVFTTQNTTPINDTIEYTTYNDTKPTDYISDYVTVPTLSADTSSPLQITTGLEMSTDSPDTTINVTSGHNIDTKPTDYTNDTVTTQTADTNSSLNTASTEMSTVSPETTINITSGHIVQESTTSPPVFTTQNTTTGNYTTEYTTYIDTKPTDYISDYVTAATLSADTSSPLNITTSLDISTDSPEITINATSGHNADENTTTPLFTTQNTIMPTNDTSDYSTSIITTADNGPITTTTTLTAAITIFNMSTLIPGDTSPHPNDSTQESFMTDPETKTEPRVTSAIMTTFGLPSSIPVQTTPPNIVSTLEMITTITKNTTLSSEDTTIESSITLPETTPSIPGYITPNSVNISSALPTPGETPPLTEDTTLPNSETPLSLPVHASTIRTAPLMHTTFTRYISADVEVTTMENNGSNPLTTPSLPDLVTSITSSEIPTLVSGKTSSNVEDRTTIPSPTYPPSGPVHTVTSATVLPSEIISLFTGNATSNVALPTQDVETGFPNTTPVPGFISPITSSKAPTLFPGAMSPVEQTAINMGSTVGDSGPSMSISELSPSAPEHTVTITSSQPFTMVTSSNKVPTTLENINTTETKATISEQIGSSPATNSSDSPTAEYTDPSTTIASSKVTTIIPTLTHSQNNTENNITFTPEVATLFSRRVSSASPISTIPSLSSPDTTLFVEDPTTNKAMLTSSEKDTSFDNVRTPTSNPGNANQESTMILQGNTIKYFTALQTGTLGPETATSNLWTVTVGAEGVTSETQTGTLGPDGATSDLLIGTLGPEGATSDPQTKISEPESATSDPQTGTFDPEGATSVHQTGTLGLQGATSYPQSLGPESATSHTKT